MPNLINTNNLSKSYNRVTTVCMSQDFQSQTTSFSGTNTSLCAAVDVGDDQWELHVTSSATNGYGSRSFNTTIGTTYNYSIDFVTPSSPGTIKIGESAGDGTHVSTVVTAADPGYSTITGSFIATTKATHISLLSNASSRTSRWDNIIITENN